MIYVTTIKDLSRDSGVSVGTISRYLNGKKVKVANKLKIDQSIEKLNYSMNYTAKSLKTNLTYTIGIIVPHVTDMFSNNIIEGMEKKLDGSTYSLIICCSRNKLSIEKDKIDFLLDKSVDGIILMPISNESAHVNKVIDRQIPVVLIDRKIEGIECDSVSSNNYKAGYEATSKLIANGHKRIGIISGSKNVSTAIQRLEGYQAALEEQLIPLDQELIEYGKYEKGGGRESIKRLLDPSKGITAIFATNYEITLTCFEYLRQHSIEIGKDISLYGFDDNELLRLLTPSIATIRQPMEKMGSEAANLLLKRIGEDYSGFPEKIELDSRVIDGGSVSQIN